MQSKFIVKLTPDLKISLSDRIFNKALLSQYCQNENNYWEVKKFRNTQTIKW